MFPRRLTTAAVLILCLLPSALAHPGRTDGNGGHYDRSTGDYHYHHGMSAHYHNADGSCPYDENWNIQHGYSTGTVNPTATPKTIFRSSSGSGSGTPKNWSTPKPATNTIPVSRSSDSLLPWIGGIAGVAGLIGVVRAVRKRRASRKNSAPVRAPAPAPVPVRPAAAPSKPPAPVAKIDLREYPVPKDPNRYIQFTPSPAERRILETAIGYILNDIARFPFTYPADGLLLRNDLSKLQFTFRYSSLPYRATVLQSICDTLDLYAKILRAHPKSSYDIRLAEKADAFRDRIRSVL